MIPASPRGGYRRRPGSGTADLPLAVRAVLQLINGPIGDGRSRRSSRSAAATTASSSQSRRRRAAAPRAPSGIRPATHSERYGGLLAGKVALTILRDAVAFDLELPGPRECHGQHAGESPISGLHRAYLPDAGAEPAPQDGSTSAWVTASAWRPSWPRTRPRSGRPGGEPPVHGDHADPRVAGDVRSRLRPPGHITPAMPVGRFAQVSWSRPQRSPSARRS